MRGERGWERGDWRAGGGGGEVARLRHSFCRIFFSPSLFCFCFCFVVLFGLVLFGCSVVFRCALFCFPKSRRPPQVCFCRSLYFCVLRDDVLPSRLLRRVRVDDSPGGVGLGGSFVWLGGSFVLGFPFRFMRFPFFFFFFQVCFVFLSWQFRPNAVTASEAVILHAERFVFCCR